MYFVATCLCLLGSLFPKLEPSFVFSWVPWMLAEVYQMPGSILSCRDPDTTKVPVRCGLGLGGSGELRQWRAGLSSGDGADQELGWGVRQACSRESRSVPSRRLAVGQEGMQWCSWYRHGGLPGVRWAAGG